MNELFTIYTILKPTKSTGDDDLIIRRLETIEEVQIAISKRFKDAYDTWVDDSQTEVIPFSPSWTPTAKQIFAFDDFIVPDWLTKAATHPEQHLKFEKKKADAEKHEIKAYLGVLNKITKEGILTETTYYLQSAYARQILDQRKYFAIFLLNGKYVAVDQTAIAIDDHVNAVIEPSGRLLFRSFRDTALLLDLSKFFKDATNDDITSILKSNKIACTKEELSLIISICDTPMRKQFAILQHNGTLEKLSKPVDDVVAMAKSFGIEINTKGNGNRKKIVFPQERYGLKQLLKFLCDDYYESQLTGEQHVSNSHRIYQKP